MTGLSLYEKLTGVLAESQVKTEEEMKKHTTFRVGGPASCYVSPGSEEELAAVIQICREREIPYFILGNGSNLLVGDYGYEGVIISMTEGFSWCEGDAGIPEVRAGSGATLSRIARTALDHGLVGLEFSAGIPGTLGGAVVMNAGAYGSEMKQVLKEARVMTEEGKILTLSLQELELGYRTSCILKNRYVVLSGTFALSGGNADAIRARMDELANLRKSRQPLEYPSAGSTFKRPEGFYAGKLIDDAGLRGFQIGGAQISEKHCGFVINKDQATARDILNLCKAVQERVMENSGVRLEMEVKRLGFFEEPVHLASEQRP